MGRMPTGFESALARWYPYQGLHEGLPLMFESLDEVVAWCRMTGIGAEEAGIRHIVSSWQANPVVFTPQGGCDGNV